MNKAVEKIFTLLNTNLLAQCPYLSGNMLNNIKVSQIDNDSARITIGARFYDLNKFKKDGVIVFNHMHYGKNGSITNYANWVNEIGAFALHNKSEHWVNRACYETVKAIANEIGAVVINKLPL